MFSYLKGQAIALQRNLQNRTFLVLEVGGIGYEIQISSRFALEINLADEKIRQVFIHYQQREDLVILYGFESLAERDLFRQLIGVSGIGAQSAIALLDTLTLSELVQAIVSENHKLLAKAPGIGKKTAERLALELRTKLAQWRDQTGLPQADVSTPQAGIFEDLEMTLLALGYEDDEIRRAVTTLSQDSLLAQNPNADEWIRQAIALLSA
ncbi:Holliday junction DNA helicase subunit RuvA [[Leptolyngbya] sp. PCC 7376]|uniref:Holliday junction branch migration protein RuvA n=1 Tax=[Leptolyngbya] sp. PCC 7376 TaxID=111781 RepID=UPI00029F4119|nr:Holliday junction branch migration protein RuvA [[Leptolyngbya] sp. PCC 7376]AFY40517.1 Holliday junction DNA helicase subunit RuvA [[Leptolyngbya] sp. PCC 7376]